MKDRVPKYPGRVKFIPVSGQTNVYTMERADQPTEEGTPINKATLLKDDTAALYGLGPDAVPDDVFRKIAAPDYAAKLIIHVATADGGSVGNTRVRIRNEELGVYLVKPLDALGNATFEVLQNHTYYVMLIDYPNAYYGGATLITAVGGQTQRETIVLSSETDVIGWEVVNHSKTVKYTGGAAGWTPAAMMGGLFEPGSVGNCWLFKNIRPCMLKNGIVQYYLDPNDFSKKADGSTADITSGNDGDVMIEIPLFYYKFQNGCKFSLSPPDNTYCANAFLSETGVIQQAMYVSAYEGVIIGGKLRSLSGAKISRDHTLSSWRSYATANGAGYQQQEWSKRTLLQALFVMLFGGLDSQALLGKGRTSATGVMETTGTMNQKGMFWGSQDGTSGVKFLGIENFWGNINKACDGIEFTSDDFSYRIHAPYGSKYDGYVTPAYRVTADDWIAGMTMSNQYGMLPSDLPIREELGYYCDRFYWPETETNRYMTTGGAYSEGSSAGIFRGSVGTTASSNMGSAYLSYTPQGG